VTDTEVRRICPSPIYYSEQEISEVEDISWKGIAEYAKQLQTDLSSLISDRKHIREFCSE